MNASWYMTQYRLMVYAKSIEVFNLGKRSGDLKRGIIGQHGQPRFKKRHPNKDVPFTLRLTMRGVVDPKLINLLD